MLSSLISFLWELFIAAPWWLEIFIVCVVFWCLVSVLLILIWIASEMLVFFGVPVLFLLEIIKGILNIIITMFKKIGLPVDSLIKIQQNIESEEKLKEKK